MEPRAKENALTQKAYAAYSKDTEILRNSSSGGVFSEIAKYFLAEGGVVCGASIDAAHQVKHILIRSEKDLPLLQGSKYVQSELYGCLREIQKCLSERKKLLFSGTPCQVAAVKKAFDCENLYTIDVLCHGVPSQKLFDEYILYLEKKHKGKLTEIVFRDKDRNGWSITQRYRIERNGKEKRYWLERHTSEYFSGYLRNMTQRESCFRCPYTTLSRCGEVTLADFWGIEKVRPELLNCAGTSLVVINNERGNALLEAIKGSISFSEVSMDEATVQNVNFFSPPERHPNRDFIYRKIFEEGYHKTGREYMLPTNAYKYRIAQMLRINLTQFHKLEYQRKLNLRKNSEPI